MSNFKTYTTANGSYDIFVNIDVENDKIYDYVYNQHSSEYIDQLKEDNRYGENEGDPNWEWYYCSATALANCLAIYYNDSSIEPLDFYESFEAGDGELSYWGTSSDNILVDTDDNSTDCPRDANGKTIAMDIDTSSQEFSDYVNEIKSSLNVGKPVIITVNRSGQTHFVTIVGIRSGISLEDAQYTDFVMFDPGTTSDKKISTLDDTYKPYTYYPYNYRIITPYLIDENGEFILDENGNKTTDVSYAQVSNSEENNEESPSVFDIIDNTDMPEHEKKRIKGIIQRDIDNKVNYAIEKAKMMMSLSILKAVHKKSNTASNTVYDPIILDLDGDGFNVETKENGVNFDLDKNGFAEKINWTTKDGFLCLDLNGNGSIDNGGEVFGDQTM